MSLFRALKESVLESEKIQTRKPVKESTQTPAVAPSPENSKIDYLQFGEKKQKKVFVCPSCNHVLEESAEFSGCPSCGNSEMRETTLTLEGGDLVGEQNNEQIPDVTLDDAKAALLKTFEDHGFLVYEDPGQFCVKNADGEACYAINEQNLNGENIVVVTCMKSGYPIVGSLANEEAVGAWVDQVVKGTESWIAENKEAVSEPEMPATETQDPPVEQPVVENPPVEQPPTETQEVVEGAGNPDDTGVVSTEVNNPEVPVEGAPGGEVPSEEKVEETVPVKMCCPECSGEFGLEACKVQGNQVMCPDCGALMDSFEVPGDDTIEVSEPAVQPQEPAPEIQDNTPDQITVS